MKQFLRLFLLLLFLAAGRQPAAAQTDSTQTRQRRTTRQVQLSGEVYDSFTKAAVKAHITLRRQQDSTFVDSMTCWVWGTSSYYELKVPARNDDFIIQASADGYEDTTMVYRLRHIARNNFFELPRLLMKKRQRSDDDIYRDVDLNGVVVTGTKVKLAYRGDTLVYNASAFNLPDGSMLDGLIRQMPGAELKDNGDIYINGKKVDYLTLNGKDFFKGQNRVMLDNLPYYTVKELKVYDKSTKQSQLVGHDVEKKDYVMDVQLKREYNRAYMANVEAGAGTDNRYLGRLFGLYYDDHSRVSVFANANNVNENRHPGSDGDWTPSQMPQGLRASKQTGLHMETEDSDKNWEENLDATFDWSDADNWTRSATERFAAGGNIMGGNEAWSRQKDFRFSANNYFQLKKPVTLWTNISMTYSNGRRNSSSQDSTYRSAIINRTVNDGLNRYRTFSMDGNIGVHHKFAWGDFFRLNFSGSYDRQKPSEGWSTNRTYYAQADSTGLRHKYTDTHGESYSFTGGLSYTLQMPNKWFIGTGVNYKQEMDISNNSLFRLDWLDPAAASQRPLDWLPSTREALMGCVDNDNTDREVQLNRTYATGLDIYHSTDTEYFYISMSLKVPYERLHYASTDLDTIVRRHYLDFHPSVTWYRWGIKKGISQLSYYMNMSRPSLLSMLPVDDTSNPLVTHINNPLLKPTITHGASIAYQNNNDSTRHFLRIWADARLTQRAIGTRTSYDRTTGAYTFMQDNVNGNWNWNLNCTYEQPLDSAKRLTLQQTADVNYNHSVDFAIADHGAGGVYEASQTSTVNNWVLHERLGLEYQKDKLTCGVSAEVSWRSATSRRDDFERISAFDYNYGAQLRYTIPWVKLTLGTDLRMYSRRGYQSSMMNTDDLVWNAELARTLFKEKLTLKLTAFDLLHQLSSKQYSINAQGRTETWNNCIPRYVMLSFVYKFNHTPSKK